MWTPFVEVIVREVTDEILEMFSNYGPEPCFVDADDSIPELDPSGGYWETRWLRKDGSFFTIADIVAKLPCPGCQDKNPDASYHGTYCSQDYLETE